MLELNNWIWAVVLFSMLACADESTQRAEFQSFQGRTMGTTYTIRYAADESVRQDHVDSILVEINQGLSTYIDNSMISRFNISGQVFMPMSNPSTDHFVANLHMAREIHELSDGAFDPTVAPLVNAWGFGWDGKAPTGPSPVELDSLKALVEFNAIGVDTLFGYVVVKTAKLGVQLDMSAIAKGYAVDVLGQFLEDRAVTDYYVEIGGEVRTKGKNARGLWWTIGINRPTIDAAATESYRLVQLDNMSLATSGNYRNYYQLDGERVWHTISPISGRPEENNLRSVSIAHPACAMADALATACMVMGVERSLVLIDQIDGAEGFFVYESEGELEHKMTDGMQKMILND